MSQYDKQLKAFTVLNRATIAVQEVAKKDVQESDLNLTEFAVLELLYHKGNQPIQMIGKKVLIASSSITYVIDKLEKRAMLSEWLVRMIAVSHMLLLQNREHCLWMRFFQNMSKN